MYKRQVDVPASKMKIAIANILLDEGYIAKYDLVEDGVFKTLHITLKYGENKNEKMCIRDRVKGAVPGPKKSLVTIKETVKSL